MRIVDWISDVCSSDLVDRAGGEDAAQRKAHVRAAERLDHDGREGEGQVLPAIVAGAVDAAPARLDERLVGLLEARGHGDRAVPPLGVLRVADAVEGRVDVGGDLAAAGDYRLAHSGGRGGEPVMLPPPASAR